MIDLLNYYIVWVHILFVKKLHWTQLAEWVSPSLCCPASGGLCGCDIWRKHVKYVLSQKKHLSFSSQSLKVSDFYLIIIIINYVL